MIRGTVNADREAVVRLILIDANGHQHPTDVIVDTGYTGWLTLPPGLIANMGWAFNRFGRAMLADSSEIAFNIYDAALLWDGQPIQIRVDAVDAEPLLGMSLMYGYRLTVEDIAGGPVIIEQL